ncbi:MAG: hypothetical protein ACFB16_25170 [Phormidesmis sp.]
MTFSTCIFFFLTVCFWRIAHSYRDEVGRLLAGAFSVVFLVIGLTTASVLIKSIILLGVLLYPAIARKHKSFFPCASCSESLICTRYSKGAPYDCYPY